MLARRVILVVLALTAAPAACGAPSAPRDSEAPAPSVCEKGPAWGPLRWEMTPEQAGKAFDAANIGYRYDEERAYFSEPVAPGAAPGPAAIVHTTSPYLMFEQGGFSGVLRFNEHDRMSEISFESKPFPRRATADTLIADLVQCYGSAHEVVPNPGGVSYRWERSAATLWATISVDSASGMWRVSERLSPRPPP
jgi:hypothetical protein